jgi:hypothetical protein
MTGGFGQGKPGDFTSDYNVAAFQIRQLLGRVHTATLVKVINVYPGGVGPIGTVDAVDLINSIDGVGNPQPHVTAYGLAYFRVVGGQNAIICDPQIGDVGIAVICDRDISSVKANQAPSNPGSRRRWSLSDGVYFGACLTASAPNQYVYFRPDGITLEDVNGNSLVTQPGSIIADTPLFACTGEIERGYKTSDSVRLGTHSHPQGNDSHGDTEVDTGAPVPGS